MLTADYFIETLDMNSHPEGGYYKEVLTSNQIIKGDSIDKALKGNRKLWTSIYFLLKDKEVSNFHKLKSDEIWYYHAGSPLTIYMITPEGALIEERVGLNIIEGEKPQILVPKNYIFGSAMNEVGFALVGCMVSPGFEFQDFQLFNRNELLEKYPQYKEVITRLTKK